MSLTQPSTTCTSGGSACLEEYPWVLRITSQNDGRDVVDEAWGHLLSFVDSITTARKVWGPKKVKAEGIRMEAVPWSIPDMVFGGKYSGIEIYVGVWEKSAVIMEESKLAKLRTLIDEKRKDLGLPLNVELQFNATIYMQDDEEPKRLPIGVFLPCRNKLEPNEHPADFTQSRYCSYPADLPLATGVPAPPYVKTRGGAGSAPSAARAKKPSVRNKSADLTPGAQASSAPPIVGTPASPTSGDKRRRAPRSTPRRSQGEAKTPDRGSRRPPTRRRVASVEDQEEVSVINTTTKSGRVSRGRPKSYLYKPTRSSPSQRDEVTMTILPAPPAVHQQL